MKDPEIPEPPDDSSAEPWRPHPLVRVALYLVVFLGSEILCLLPALLMWSSWTGVPIQAASEAEPTLAWLLFFAACYAPICGLVTRLFLRHLDHAPPAVIAWGWPGGDRRLGLAHAAVATAAVAAVLGGWLVGGLTWGGLTLTAAPAYGSLGTALVFLLGFLVQSGVEELVFRGYVYHTARERLPWAHAAGLSAALFAALHALNPQVSSPALANTFLIGLALAAVVEATGSLVAPTVIHGMWNFLLGCGLGAPLSGLPPAPFFGWAVEGPAAVMGGAYGPEGSWALTLGLLPLALGLTVWAERRRARRNTPGE